MGMKSRKLPPREIGTAPPHRHRFELKTISSPPYARCIVDWCGVLRLIDSPVTKRLIKRFEEGDDGETKQLAAASS